MTGAVRPRQLLLMKDLVKNQHYVWRAYLRPWAKDERIHCWRRRENKIFSPNLINIGSETFFYRVQPMTPPDIEYLNAIVADEPEDLKPLFRDTLDWLQIPFDLQDPADSPETDDNPDEAARPANIDQLVEYLVQEIMNLQRSGPTMSLDEARDRYKQALEERRAVRERLAKTIADEFQGLVEDEGLAFLAPLRARDCAFIGNEADCRNFFNFLAHQRFRTRTFREVAYGPDKLLPGVDLQRTWLVENHIRATRLGLDLFMARYELGFVFLKNETETPFVSCDQPIIELGGDDGELPELYYPLGPALAMILGSRKSCHGDAVSIETACTAEQVSTYNHLMIEGSFDQVYANDRAFLTALSERAARQSCEDAACS